MNAAHFVHGSFLSCLWSKVRLYVPSSPGRMRFNVLGALNAVTKEVITVENEGYINAASVGELLIKINQHRNCKKVTVILDNARYQTCNAVKEVAAKLDIDLLFLPPYSPNLNLIERLWKFVKRYALNSKYYPDFSDFKNAIISVLRPDDIELFKELETLLSLEFQDFSIAKISTV